MEETPQNFSPREKCTKSTFTFKRSPDLADEYAAISPPSSEKPKSDAFVLDGPAVIQMIKPKNRSAIDENSKTFLSGIQT